MLFWSRKDPGYPENSTKIGYGTIEPNSRTTSCWLGWGVNREGLISNWSWPKRVSFGSSWTNMPFRKIWSQGLDPTVTSDPYISLWKRQKSENGILFLHWSKCIPINLKGTLQIFNGKFEKFNIPQGSQMWRNYHVWPKNQPFET